MNFSKIINKLKSMVGKDTSNATIKYSSKGIAKRFAALLLAGKLTMTTLTGCFFKKNSVDKNKTETKTMNFSKIINKLKSAVGKDTSNATIKYSSKGTAKRFAALLLAGTLTMTTLTGCFSKKNSVDENKTETAKEFYDPNYRFMSYDTEGDININSNLSPDFNFNPNSYDTMVSKVTEFILDAREKGVELSPRDGINLYRFVNGQWITTDFIKQLNYQIETIDDLIDSCTGSLNKLREDAMTMDERTIIDVSILMSRKDDVDLIKKMQAWVANWNSASNDEKSSIGVEINKFIDEHFLDDNARAKISHSTNVWMLKLISAIEDMSINSTVKVPPKEVANILFYDDTAACLGLKGDLTAQYVNYTFDGASVYNKEMSYARRNIDSKMISIDWFNNIVIEGKTGYDAELAIKRKVEEANIALGVNPDINKMRAQNSTVVYEDQKHPERKQVSPNDKIVGNSVIIPQTTSEKKAQQEAIQENLNKENATKLEKVTGTRQEGATAGFWDGFGGKNTSGVSLPKADLSGKSEDYKIGYETGYAEGQKELKKHLEAVKTQHGQVIKEEFTPINGQNDVQVVPNTDNGITNQSVTDQKDTTVKQDKVVEEQKSATAEKNDSVNEQKKSTTTTKSGVKVEGNKVTDPNINNGESFELSDQYEYGSDGQIYEKGKAPKETAEKYESNDSSGYSEETHIDPDTGETFEYIRDFTSMNTTSINELNALKAEISGLNSDKGIELSMGSYKA